MPFTCDKINGGLIFRPWNLRTQIDTVKHTTHLEDADVGAGQGHHLLDVHATLADDGANKVLGDEHAERLQKEKRKKRE